MTHPYHVFLFSHIAVRWEKLLWLSGLTKCLLFFVCVSERWGELSCPSVRLYLFLWHPWSSRLPRTGRMTPRDLIGPWLIFCMRSSCVITSWHSFSFPRESQVPVVRKARREIKAKRWDENIHLGLMYVYLPACVSNSRPDLTCEYQSWLDPWCAA